MNSLQLIAIALLVQNSFDFQKEFLCSNIDFINHTLTTQNNIDVLIATYPELVVNSKDQNQINCNIPSDFEMCEYQAPWCSIGEPIKYYGIDSTLTKQIIIIVEKNRNDQKRYEIYSPNLKDSISKSIRLENEKYGIKPKSNETLLIENGLVSKTINEYSNNTIQGYEFFGQGSTSITKRGLTINEYKIYGKIKSTLIGIELLHYGEDNQIDPDLLYCILESVELTST